jgi:hypothetical protein
MGQLCPRLPWESTYTSTVRKDFARWSVGRESIDASFVCTKDSSSIGCQIPFDSVWNVQLIDDDDAECWSQGESSGSFVLVSEV